MLAPASHPPSLWTATAIPDRDWPTLEGSVQADVAIVGGGFTGCAAALALAERGAKPALVEANLIGWGASGRTGGQVIPGLKYDPDEIDAMFGPELGPRVVAAVGSVGDEVFGLIAKHAIACNPVRKGWLQPAFSSRTLATATRRADQWARRGADVAVLDRAQISALIGSDLYLGGWIDRRAGHLQPLSYVRGLAAAAHDAGSRDLRALTGDLARAARQPVAGRDTARRDPRRHRADRHQRLHRRAVAGSGAHGRPDGELPGGDRTAAAGARRPHSSRRTVRVGHAPAPLVLPARRRRSPRHGRPRAVPRGPGARRCGSPACGGRSAVSAAAASRRSNITGPAASR